MASIDTPHRSAVQVGAATAVVLAAAALVPVVRDALEPLLDTPAGVGLFVVSFILVVTCAGLLTIVVSRRRDHASDLSDVEGGPRALEPAQPVRGAGEPLDNDDDVTASVGSPLDTWRAARPGGLRHRGLIPPALAGMAATLEPTDERIAYVAIDVLDLGKVNRMFNYDVGDAVLEDVIGRLQRTMTEGDMLFHYAGDEFVLLRPGVADLTDVDELAAGILAAFAEDLPIDGYSIAVRANLGIALVGPSGLDVADARSAAESALYRSTLQGPNRYEIYSHSARRELSPGFVAEWLHRSIAQRQFRVYYQRIDDLESRGIVGAEALLRWDHPDLGGLEPRDVLPALRDTGLIVELGEHIIDEVCRQIAAWTREMGEQNVPMVFVNVDPLQLAHGNFLPSVEESLRRHGVSADKLCFELGQLSTLPRHSTAWSVLREAKALGLTLALDNFGGSESNFAVLRTVQLAYLKLDRSIVSARTGTAIDESFARGMVALSRDLGCVVIAEGIEDAASAERARHMGCELGQGYHLGPPVPGSVLGEELASLSGSVGAH